MPETEQVLAAAQQAVDEAKVDSLRKQQLDMEECSLCAQQTILLQAQAPDQHCFSCQNSLRLHTNVWLCYVGPLPTWCCPLATKKHIFLLE